MLIVVVTAVSLFVLAAVFLGLFFLPGVLHWLRLWQIWQQLKKIEGRTHPGELRKIFSADAEMAHIWKEYADS
ncbi:MAG: tellurium resistance protein TerC, partial [Leptothrix ochracea]